MLALVGTLAVVGGLLFAFCYVAAQLIRCGVVLILMAMEWIRGKVHG